MNNLEYDADYDYNPTEFELWYKNNGLGGHYDDLSNSEKAEIKWRYKEYLRSGKRIYKR